MGVAEEEDSEEDSEEAEDEDDTDEAELELCELDEDLLELADDEEEKPAAAYSKHPMLGVVACQATPRISFPPVRVSNHAG